MPVGGIGAGIYNILKGPGGSKEKDYLKEILKRYEDVPLPEFERLVAPQLIQTGEITPQLYDAIIQGQAPEIQEDPALREAQLRGILGMEQVAREGLPLADRLRAQEAQRAVAGELGRADEAVLRDLQRRGRAGGGTELAARLATQGRAAETARGIGTDLAQQSVANRLMALRAAPEMAGAVRGQDFQSLARNAAMQQRYNEFVSNLMTQAAQNAAQQRAQAQQLNLAERQRIADFNRMAPYQAAQDRNELERQMFEARRRRTGDIAGALSGLGKHATIREGVKRRQIEGLGGSIDQLLGTVAGGAFGGPAGAAAGSSLGSGVATGSVSGPGEYFR